MSRPDYDESTAGPNPLTEEDLSLMDLSVLTPTLEEKKYAR